MMLPDHTVILEHQTAGHRHDHGKLYTGMLKHQDGFVMKPVQDDERGNNEINFYEQVFQSSSDPLLSKLKKHIPHYLGLHQFVTEHATRYFIKMEDVAAGFVKPCIADIKIGRQTWDPHSSPEKRLAEDKKYIGTKEPYGFCVPGMNVYSLTTKETIKYDKHYGRSLNTSTIKEALLVYLNSAEKLNKGLITDFLNELYAIREWFEEQRLYLFYATSLLLVYDADALEKNQSVQKVRVRMIDFAHVYPAHHSRDANYIHGLTNLIQLLEELISDANK